MNQVRGYWASALIVLRASTDQKHAVDSRFGVVASDNTCVSVLNLLPTGISFQSRQFAAFS